MPGRTKITRSIRSTSLIYCEGAHDLAFIRHLVVLYSPESPSAASIRTRQGNGGAADKLVQSALNVPGSFNRILVKLDSDRGVDDPQELERATRLATANGIILVFSTPCLDALLLDILAPGKDYTQWQSKTCKAKFERDYLSPIRRTSALSYNGYFPSQIIQEARKRIRDLDELLKFIEQN